MIYTGSYMINVISYKLLSHEVKILLITGTFDDLHYIL